MCKKQHEKMVAKFTTHPHHLHNPLQSVLLANDWVLG